MTNPTTPAIDIRPEAELLLCCARTRMNPESAERIKALLQSDIDWEKLLPLARWHRMLPLLYWHLNNICPEAVPDATLVQLRSHCQANVERNLSLTGELIKLLKLFKANNIPTLPYKGPVLAATVYGNLALRPSVDLDILVHKRDVLRAKMLLISQGYQPEYQLSPVQEAAHMQSRCEYNFNRGPDRLHVEIHWQIVPRRLGFQFDFDDLWEGLESVPPLPSI